MPEDTVITPKFPATRWSVVLTASGHGVESHAALEELCQLYWFPLYAFARQRGLTTEDAEDQTQEFLAQVVGGGMLSTALPERGKLRTYLLAAFQLDLIDAHRRSHREKRGGGITFVSLETLSAEDRFLTISLHESPASAYDRAWAMTCLDTAVNLLAAEYASRGRDPLFQALRSFLDPDLNGDYTVASKAIGLDTNAVRQAVFRLRQRFRILLRQTIADTLEHPSEAFIEEELTALRAALMP